MEQTMLKSVKAIASGTDIRTALELSHGHKLMQKAWSKIKINDYELYDIR